MAIQEYTPIKTLLAIGSACIQAIHFSERGTGHMFFVMAESCCNQCDLRFLICCRGVGKYVTVFSRCQYLIT